MNDRLQRNATYSNTIAADIVLKFIGFLVADGERLDRFCALTGMGQAELKSGLTDRTMQGFLLDYALSDESLLLAFAADLGLQPEAIVRARHALPGYSE